MKDPCPKHQPYGNVYCVDCVRNHENHRYIPPEDSKPPVLPVLPGSNVQWCEHYKMLDRVYNTSTLSPLHHDNRCLWCAGNKPQGQPEYMLRQVIANKFMPVRLKENAGYELAKRRKQL